MDKTIYVGLPIKAKIIISYGQDGIPFKASQIIYNNLIFKCKNKKIQISKTKLLAYVCKHITRI